MTREEAYRLILSQMRLPPPEFSEEELSSLIRFVQASGIRPEGPGGAPFSLEGRRYLEPSTPRSGTSPSAAWSS
ncbi:hypothetical protein [Thermus antranikianii]|uniref:hypothetical protein n=1 Tax=Thermus antranikianii TaxID=88190 RepID=UPI001C743DF0|nr:hypothetical protein [Thermus antranikianii]QWK20809.1 MAG: hypothetical protein KNN15_06965 [Thermus antranikianii]